jgi:hypothetical protein
MIPEQKLQRKLKVIDQLWVIVENAAGMVFCTCIVNIDFKTDNNLAGNLNWNLTELI